MIEAERKRSAQDRSLPIDAYAKARGCLSDRSSNAEPLTQD